VIYIRVFTGLSLLALVSAIWLGPIMIVCALGFGLIVGLLFQAKKDDELIARSQELDRRQADLEDIAAALIQERVSAARPLRVVPPRLGQSGQASPHETGG
jgi:hypothetical protein